MEIVASQTPEQRGALARIKLVYERYERFLMSGAFLLGFIIDNLTLTRIDRVIDNAILTGYLSIATTSIILWGMYIAGKFQSTFFRTIGRRLPYVIQFCFGALFSGFIVFYSRSGSLIANWPFFALLALLFLGNEGLRKHYERLTFQVLILFTTIFLYSIFVLPIITGSIGAGMFIASGIVSLFVIHRIIWILFRVGPDGFKENRALLWLGVISIFSALNFLYFTNMIPPLPLSLKEIGVYHNVTKVGDSYILDRESRSAVSWLFKPVFHRVGNEPVYVYSSIFAPTRLSTTISHEWSYFDERSKKWISTGTIEFPINGGRDGGYRGYSIKENAFPGRWRVNVSTSRGQLIGRIDFTIEQSVRPAPLRQNIQQFPL